MEKEKTEKKWEREEVLDLAQLMDVQGGIDQDEEKIECGLGCYNNGTIEIDPIETGHSHEEG